MAGCTLLLVVVQHFRLHRLIFRFFLKPCAFLTMLCTVFRLYLLSSMRARLGGQHDLSQLNLRSSKPQRLPDYIPSPLDPMLDTVALRVHNRLALIQFAKGNVALATSPALILSIAQCESMLRAYRTFRNGVALANRISAASTSRSIPSRTAGQFGQPMPDIGTSEQWHEGGDTSSDDTQIKLQRCYDYDGCDIICMLLNRDPKAAIRKLTCDICGVQNRNVDIPESVGYGCD